MVKTRQQFMTHVANSLTSVGAFFYLLSLIELYHFKTIRYASALFMIFAPVLAFFSRRNFRFDTENEKPTWCYFLFFFACESIGLSIELNPTLSKFLERITHGFGDIVIEFFAIFLGIGFVYFAIKHMIAKRN